MEKRYNYPLDNREHVHVRSTISSMVKRHYYKPPILYMNI